jgi:hypothetical protein
VFTRRRAMDGATFALGKITITAGAVAALAESSQHAAEFLARHARGDWGEVGHFAARGRVPRRPRTRPPPQSSSRSMTVTTGSPWSPGPHMALRWTSEGVRSR